MTEARPLPTIVGNAGSAWLLPPASEDYLADHPDWRANLVNWVMTVPGAHPLWDGYVLSLVHLRDLPGVRPAIKNSPDAEFELILYALDPDRPLPIVTDVRDFVPRCLHPVNLVYQFGHVNDEQAIEITKMLATAFVRGHLNPDTDWRRDTIRSLDATIEHYRSGVHK